MGCEGRRGGNRRQPLASIRASSTAPTGRKSVATAPACQARRCTAGKYPFFGVWETGLVERIGEQNVLLLAVEEAVEDDAFSRRDRDHHALIGVPDTPAAETVDSLRAAMSWPGELDEPEVARYKRVCIVAFPSSPVRTWVTAFFAAEARWLVEGRRLWWCLPPFDRRHATPMSAGAALGLADQWEQLRPDPPPPTQSGPKLHPGSDRPGSGGFWSGPQVVVVAGNPTVCHLRVREGRRSFCGRPAKELDFPEPYVWVDEVPKERRCPDCTGLWWQEIRPQRERERRDV